MLLAMIISAFFHVTPVVGDMAITEYALANYSELREQNIQSREERIAINLGIAASSMWLDRKLEKRSKAMMWSFRAARFLLGAYICHKNLETIQEVRSRRKQFP